MTGLGSTRLVRLDFPLGEREWCPNTTEILESAAFGASGIPTASAILNEVEGSGAKKRNETMKVLFDMGPARHQIADVFELVRDADGSWVGEQRSLAWDTGEVEEDVRAASGEEPVVYLPDGEMTVQPLLGWREIELVARGDHADHPSWWIGKKVFIPLEYIEQKEAAEA